MVTQSSSVVPAHIAIIMDGNGRWAQARGLPRLSGHKQGAEAVAEIVRAAAEKGVRYLTLFAFSTENWKRPAEEVNGLMGMLRMYLSAKTAEMHKNNVCLKVVGNRDGLADDIIAAIESAEKLTENNDGITVIVAFNYSGKWDILQATQKLAAQVKSGVLSADDMTDDVFSAALCTAGIPDPDLIIRTSGEKRVSNFLLWQGAYSEYYFADCHWPDFNQAELEQAIASFGKRDRRYGAVNVQAS